MDWARVEEISGAFSCVCQEWAKPALSPQQTEGFSVLFSFLLLFFSSVQFSSVTQSFLTLCYPMNHSTPGLPVHHQLPEPTQTHVHWVGDAIQPSHPPLSPSPPALNLSQHQGLSKWVSFSHQVAKVLEFQLQHQSSASNEHPGLISFRMDWLDLLEVQGTLKSLLQQHSSKASILRHSAFFIVQLSHPYMTIGKTIALNRRTFVDKVMSLLFNMLSKVGHNLHGFLLSQTWGISSQLLQQCAATAPYLGCGVASLGRPYAVTATAPAPFFSSSSAFHSLEITF